MDLALNNLQRLIRHKTQLTNQPTKSRLKDLLGTIYESKHLFKNYSYLIGILDII